MKTLVVDNNTTLLSELCNIVPSPYEVVKLEDVKKVNLEEVDLIVLSGASHHFPVMGYEDLLTTEIDLILNSGKPMIGVCYGCELIARSFGAVLTKRQSKNKGEVEIRILQKDAAFTGMENFKSYENHGWVISKLPDNLEALAESEHGIEIFKHKTLPIYGIQFHPEKIIGVNTGKVIFENIVRYLSNKN